MGFPFGRKKRGIGVRRAAEGALAHEEESLVADEHGPSYLGAEREAWPLAVSWRGLLFATLLLAGLAVVVVLWQ